MANHRYWRIHARVNAGGTFVQFAEVEMRAAVGGADQCNGGTPSCSGSIQAGSAAGVFANDGVTSFVQWSGTTDKWVAYDFGAGNEKDIVEVAITGATGAANRSPSVFDVQYSDDGVTWTTAWSVIYTTAWVTGTAVAFAKPAVGSGAARYWRLRLLESFVPNNNILAISEMEMRATVGGADECAGGTALARTNGGAGFVPANAFANDGLTTGYASAAGIAESEYLGYDFGAGNAKDIVEVTWLPRDDSTNWKQGPRTGVIEASSDGVNWIPRWSFANRLAARGYTSRLIAPGHVPAGPTAYHHRFWGLKVNATQNAAKPFGLAELVMPATPGGAAYTTGGMGVSRNPFGGSVPTANAFDGLSSEFGTDINNGGGTILAYDFGIGNEKILPAEIAITARAAGISANHEQSPIDFDLVHSEDGETWTVQEHFTTPADWTSSQVRTFAVTGGGVLPGGSRRRQITIGN